MKIFETACIPEIDRYTIIHEPIFSIDLMKRAARIFTSKILELIPRQATVKIFAGNGNNGGDAFFVAQYLIESQYEVLVFHCHPDATNISNDCKLALDNFRNLHPDKIHTIKYKQDLPVLTSTDWIIDGIFGSGLNRPLNGIYEKIVQHINSSGCTTVAIDIPSGLMGEDNSNNISENIIQANYTFSFQFPKLSFLFPENETFVGHWDVLDIQLQTQAIEDTKSPFFLTDQYFIDLYLRKRRKFSHKGTFGHVLLIGGSYGKMGAVVLASKACLRAGAGLLTAHVPSCGYEIMQISVPEAMLSIDDNKNHFSQYPPIESYKHVGIGIGLGQQTESKKAFKHLIKQLSSPAVFDADALNIISANKELLKEIPVNSILTPHPKEFERLAGKTTNSYERLQKLIDFSKQYQLYIVLKDAYTCICTPEGDCWFNNTGNPGMATAGSGDVLCGIILGLLSQGYTPFEAAVIGTFAHGKAGDEAATKRSQASMIAGDIIENLKI